MGKGGFTRSDLSTEFKVYYVRGKAQMQDNRQFFKTGMEFAKNLYAYLLKAPSRN